MASASRKAVIPSWQFLEERSVILQPVLTHTARLIKDTREYEHVLRASQILLEAEEPSARTFFCAKAVVTDYIAKHPRDPRGHRELGKVYLFSCSGDETTDSAEQCLLRASQLSSHKDAETWFLLAAVHRTRLLGSTSSSPHYKAFYSRAERCLQLALHHSYNARSYRFALSDFYFTTGSPSLALETLEQGLSGRVDDPTDAEVWEELGKYGMKFVPELISTGKVMEAREVAQGAVAYLRKALSAAVEVGHTDMIREWQIELEEAQEVLEDLTEGTLFDFALEPDYNPSRPTFASADPQNDPSPPSPSPSSRSLVGLTPSPPPTRTVPPKSSDGHKRPIKSLKKPPHALEQKLLATLHWENENAKRASVKQQQQQQLSTNLQLPTNAHGQLHQEQEECGRKPSYDMPPGLEIPSSRTTPACLGEEFPLHSGMTNTGTTLQASARVKRERKNTMCRPAKMTVTKASSTLAPSEPVAKRQSVSLTAPADDFVQMAWSTVANASSNLSASDQAKHLSISPPGSVSGGILACDSTQSSSFVVVPPAAPGMESMYTLTIKGDSSPPIRPHRMSMSKSVSPPKPRSRSNSQSRFHSGSRSRSPSGLRCASRLGMHDDNIVRASPHEHQDQVEMTAAMNPEHHCVEPMDVEYNHPHGTSMVVDENEVGSDDGGDMDAIPIPHSERLRQSMVSSAPTVSTRLPITVTTTTNTTTLPIPDVDAATWRGQARISGKTGSALTRSKSLPVRRDEDGEDGEPWRTRNVKSALHKSKLPLINIVKRILP